MTTIAVPKFYPAPEEQAAAKMLGVPDITLWSVMTKREDLLWFSVRPDAPARMFFVFRYGEDPVDFITQMALPSDELQMGTLMRHRLHTRVQLEEIQGLSDPFVPVPGVKYLYEAPAHVWLRNLPAWNEYIGVGHLAMEKKE